MCGITGIWNCSEGNENYLKNKTSEMSKKLFHRGPDNIGLWWDVKSQIYLGHLRLSILDLSSAGNQPMQLDDNYVISYNGEIYNHIEIRKELNTFYKRDINWRSNSDTETILVSIKTWGIEEAINKFDGMFAIALWDKSKKELHLIRDRFGEKPLYWGYINIDDNYSQKALVFASDLGALRALKKEFKLNNKSAIAYFKRGYLPTSYSIYQDIFQLEPGHIITFNSDISGFANKENKSSRKWWDIENETNYKKCSGEESITNLNNILNEVIDQQSLSDVNLGCFLSGGIDSSLVASIMQSQSNLPIKTLSVSFNQNKDTKSNFDESFFANQVAKYIGSDHNQIYIKDDELINIVSKLPEIYTEPLSDVSLIPTYFLCKYAKNMGLSVALSGDGGDEFFGGYSRHKLIPKIYNQLKSFPNEGRRILSILVDKSPILNKDSNATKKIKLITAIKNSSSIEKLYESIVSKWNNPNEILSNSFFKKEFLEDNHSINNSYLYNKFKGLISDEEIIMLFDSINYLPSNILVKLDRAAMSNSLETRCPFLDNRVTSFAMKLPLSLKIKKKSYSTESKWILKKILEKYIPKKMIYRPKQGFTPPMGAWLRGPLKGWAESLLLSNNNLSGNEFLDKKIVERIWEKHLQEEKDLSEQIWTILIWKGWSNKWLNI